MKAITGLAHLALKVKDIDRSLAFYKNVLEFPEMLRLHHQDGSLFLVYLRVTETQYVEIFPDAVEDRAPGVTANGVHHFCLEVDKLETVIDRFIANGGTSFAQWVEGELVPSCVPVVGTGLDRNRQCWITDPDGNRIELMEMANDSLQYQAIRRLRDELA